MSGLSVDVDSGFGVGLVEYVVGSGDGSLLVLVGEVGGVVGTVAFGGGGIVGFRRRCNRKGKYSRAEDYQNRQTFWRRKNWPRSS